MKLIITKDWKRDTLLAFFLLFPMGFGFLGSYVFDNVLITALVAMSSFLLFAAYIFFTAKKGDIFVTSNNKHSRRAGWFAIAAFILFWVVGLFVIFEERFGRDVFGAFLVFIAMPLGVVLSYSAALLIIFFGVKSLLERKTIVKTSRYGGAGEISGTESILPSIIYILIGLTFLFMLLSLTYEVAVCPQFHIQEDCGNNIFTKTWYFLTNILTLGGI